MNIESEAEEFPVLPPGAVTESVTCTAVIVAVEAVVVEVPVELVVVELPVVELEVVEPPAVVLEVVLGGLIVREAVFEVSPFVTTVTWAVPGSAMSLASTVAVSCVGDT